MNTFLAHISTWTTPLTFHLNGKKINKKEKDYIDIKKYNEH